VSIALGLLAVVALILANGVFVAAEFALVAVDRSQVAVEVERGSRAARTVEAILRRLSFSLSGAQLGITLCSLGLGVLSEPVVAPLLEPIFGPLDESTAVAASVAAALLLTTVVQMVIGELIPKGVAVAKPLSTSLAMAAPFRFFVTLFHPVIVVCNAAADGLLRLVGIQPAEELRTVRSRDELHRLVQTSHEGGTLVLQAADLLDRSFRFREKTAADALTPRMEIQALPVDGTTGDLLAASERTGLSRFPVTDGDLDQIVGVVHVKDVLGIDPERRRSTPLREILRPVAMVPESSELGDLLVQLQDQSGQFAVVLDEYGATAGIITLEDLVEEIVGDISDEHDPAGSEPLIRRWQGAHLLSGRLHPDEVEEACGFEIPEGPYETLAGFVLARLGSIPEVGDGFTERGWSLEVSEMDGRRVAVVRLVAPPPGWLPEHGGDGREVGA
jgi:CBS domain containing-hemolysin-like protein